MRCVAEPGVGLMQSYGVYMSFTRWGKHRIRGYR